MKILIFFIYRVYLKYLNIHIFIYYYIQFHKLKDEDKDFDWGGEYVNRISQNRGWGILQMFSKIDNEYKIGWGNFQRFRLDFINDNAFWFFSQSKDENYFTSILVLYILA